MSCIFRAPFLTGCLLRSTPAATREAGDRWVTSGEQLPNPSRAVLSAVLAPTSSKPVFLKGVFTCGKAFQITFRSTLFFSVRGLSWLQTSETSLR